MLGRWHSQDPIINYASPYNGIGNNPVNLIDHMGMFTWGGTNWNPYGQESATRYDGGASYGGSGFSGGFDTYDVVSNTFGNFTSAQAMVDYAQFHGDGATFSDGKATSYYHYNYTYDHSLSEKPVKYTVDGVEFEQYEVISECTKTKVEVALGNKNSTEGGGFMESACNVANAINEYNPIAQLMDVVAYAFTGKDRFGNPLTLTQANLKALAVVPIPIGKIASISRMTPGLQALFKEGVAGNSIINIRSTLMDNGFTQTLTTNKAGYLFTNDAGEQVRIMFRNGGWDVRIQNQFGNYLDNIGRVASPSSSHGISVFSW